VKWANFIGTSTEQGRRDSNEDRMAYKLLFTDPNSEEKFSDRTTLYAGVFDGHGGVQAAQFLSQTLHRVIEQISHECDYNFSEAIPKAFDACDQIFRAESSLQKFSSGSTVACILMPQYSSTLTIANLGDCEVIVSKKGRAYPLTEVHSTHHPQELNRIRSEGATIIEDPYGRERLNGVLEITRSFGASAWRNLGVSSVPHIKTYQIQDDDNFIVIASDGVFSQLTKQHICDIVKFSTTPQQAANALTWVATTQNNKLESIDNATAIVVSLKGWGTSSSVHYTKELERRGLRSIFGHEFEPTEHILSLLDNNAEREEILKYIFSMFDRNHTNEISVSDITNGMRELGCHILESQVDLVLALSDSNKSKDLSEAEFIAAVNRSN